MRVIGLTGGIGSGKSTFAAFLAELGAHVIDADMLGRDALRPGEPAWHSVVDTFGNEVLQAGSMEIDRKRLAAEVFPNPRKLAALNAITHPVIMRSIADTLDRLSPTEAVVVIDAALIVELGLTSILDELVVVAADADLRRLRLRERGLSPDDVDARMEAQADPRDLLEKADVIVRNDGSFDSLQVEARRLWERLGGVE